MDAFTQRVDREAKSEDHGMPAIRKKERIVGRYFSWLIGKRNDVFVADGRANHPNDLGRHSLGTRDRQQAMERLARLDLIKGVELGLADRSLLDAVPDAFLSLDEGRRLYLEHVRRPPVLGGAGESTQKRYRAVLDKFIPFAHKEGVRNWQSVTKKLLEAYGAWLDEENYSLATEYLELTTLKQIMGWLAAEKHIPTSCLFALPLEKPQGTSTYCYKPKEVQNMIAHCLAHTPLVWLGEVIIGLATTGLRIGELASLRWKDFDFQNKMIRLTDDRSRATRANRRRVRATKTHRDRVLPMQRDLYDLLQRMTHNPDGLVFHGPLGGRLKPDTVRNVLVREVLESLAKESSNPPEEKGFRQGRLHSFRHYFCSVCANYRVPEHVLMTWLGHQDSKMVRHYYHLFQEESQRQMAKIEIWKEAMTSKRKGTGRKENRRNPTRK
jgi:integrase